jgi:hypothetical protein
LRLRVEEQPPAVAAQLQPREPVRAQQVDRRDRDRPQAGGSGRAPGPHHAPSSSVPRGRCPRARPVTTRSAPRGGRSPLACAANTA